MAINTRERRMAALSPVSPWRGPLVDATVAGFAARARAAVLGCYFIEQAVIDVGCVSAMQVFQDGGLAMQVQQDGAASIQIQQDGAQASQVGCC